MCKKLQADEWKITFPNLGRIDLLKLIVFSDASHANLPDGFSSAGSFVIFLVGQDGRSCPLSWQSKKIQRVVKSTIPKATLAMVKATDMSFYLAFILKEILLHNNDQLNIPIECYIDNHSLWDSIHSTKRVSEKRLRIDLGSLKMMLEKKEITRVT